jgi:cytochrome P450
MATPNSTLRSSPLPAYGGAKEPPAPRGLPLIGNTAGLRHDAPGVLLQGARQYGPVVQYWFVVWRVYAINHPDGAKRILQDNNRNYNKDVVDYVLLRYFLGQGLLTSDGDSWLRQRRLMQPAFHRPRIAGFASLMTDEAQTTLAEWEGSSKSGETLDVFASMMRLTLRIVCRALFSTDIEQETNIIGTAFTELNRRITRYSYFPFPPLSVPTPGNRKIAESASMLQRVVDGIIARRRRDNVEHDDLLSMLLHAQDADTGERMSDQQVRDEVTTLLLAGHETTANALSWTWYLLAQHPEAEAKLRAELDSVLGGRLPTMDDLERLPYNRMVIEEALRLYPPAWLISRNAMAEDEICGYRIPAHAYILLSTYTIHRHPDFWEHPDTFDPERFTPERVAARPRYAYFPFGGGPRQCIGNTFALTEAQLILATIAQRCRLALVPGHKVSTEALITLRPRDGILVNIQRRNG